MRHRIDRLETVTAYRTAALLEQWSASMATFTDADLAQIADGVAEPALLTRFEIATGHTDDLLVRWLAAGGDAVTVFGDEAAALLTESVKPAQTDAPATIERKRGTQWRSKKSRQLPTNWSNKSSN